MVATAHTPITPSLFIGEPPPSSTPVRTAEEAVLVIESGGTPVLPEGSWDEARKTLEVVANKAIAMKRVAQARREDSTQDPTRDPAQG